MCHWRMPACGTAASSGWEVRERGRAGAAVLALHVVGGPDAGRTIALDRGRLHIGRDPACDLALADVDVSRRHAVIDIGQRDIVLHDLDSMNGTQVDGRQVPPDGSALRPGAVIRIGDSFLTVAGPGDAPATLQPAADGRRLVHAAAAAPAAGK